MWDIFDQWIVLMALGWASWIIYRTLTKRSFLSCNTPCDKKLFTKKPDLVELKRKK